jgi:2-succinyl-6-hydroxy-2,4-cyclohexadiene-1-carboxylate synthase
MPLFATLPAGQRARLEAVRAMGAPVELARALVGMGTGAQPDLWPDLTRLAMPVTAVAGALDPKFEALARAMQVAHPALQVIQVAGAGHNVHVEVPDVFADVVRARIP